MIGRKSLALLGICTGLVVAPVGAHALTGLGLGVQAGYGSVEAELQLPGGYFLDFGIPWFVAAADARTSDIHASLPLGGKLGTQFNLLGPLSIRSGARFIYNPRTGPEDRDLTRTLGFLDVGARLELPGGLVFGADAALLGFDKEKGSDSRFRGPGDALPFSQAYIGWMLSL